MTPASLASLQAGQAVIEERVTNLKTEFKQTTERIVRDVNDKHLENRAGRHEIRNDLQEIRDEVWKLKVKVAVYAGAGAGGASGIVELLKWLFHH